VWSEDGGMLSDTTNRRTENDSRTVMLSCSLSLESGGSQYTLIDTRQLYSRGAIYEISYDLSQDYRKLIVRSTYDSDLQRAKRSLGNIVS